MSTSAIGVPPPVVVAIGGGAGLSATLRAVVRYASDVTAVVSMADNGGSTGRLREAGIDVVPGDLRKCLLALAESESFLAAAKDHRMETDAPSDLTGHAVGNLMIAALIAECGDTVTALDYLAALLGVRGRVLPVADRTLTLVGHTAAGRVTGQIQVNATAQLETVSVEPSDCCPPVDVLDAILSADQIVLGPGSLYTSVLAALVVPGIVEAVSETAAQVVYVANLQAQMAETAGYDLADHVSALKRHGVVPDVVLVDHLTPDAGAVDASVGGASVRSAPLRRTGAHVHDPELLHVALSGVYESRFPPLGP